MKKIEGKTGRLSEDDVKLMLQNFPKNELIPNNNNVEEMIKFLSTSSITNFYLETIEDDYADEFPAPEKPEEEAKRPVIVEVKKMMSIEEEKKESEVKEEKVEREDKVEKEEKKESEEKEDQSMTAVANEQVEDSKANEVIEEVPKEIAPITEDEKETKDAEVKDQAAESEAKEEQLEKKEEQPEETGEQPEEKGEHSENPEAENENTEKPEVVQSDADDSSSSPAKNEHVELEVKKMLPHY
eukprot:TRINITY_DN6085_c0_g1_i2.p1 TRINITY_DN6085_c0_g1~~TRINITY_DN6085_c0_g1_i2.p1  ORF type:complete len:242 (-),score=104.48 TRINITY_DN6085_c0_g1_i2:167-892(-)